MLTPIPWKVGTAAARISAVWRLLLLAKSSNWPGWVNHKEFAWQKISFNTPTKSAIKFQTRKQTLLILPWKGYLKGALQFHLPPLPMLSPVICASPMSASKYVYKSILLITSGNDILCETHTGVTQHRATLSHHAFKQGMCWYWLLIQYCLYWLLIQQSNIPRVFSLQPYQIYGCLLPRKGPPFWM